MVRGVGPGVPHASPLAHGRPRLRQGPARPDAARALPPPERADAGLRVELQRRQPAGARLGHAVRLRVRARAARARATSPGCESAFQKLLRQLHLVGQPQGPRRHATCSRAASSAWTTSACSTAARRCPTGGHLEQADGTAWMAFFSQNMLEHRARAGRGTTRSTRTSCSSSSSTSSGSPPRWTASATTTTRCGTRRTASSTTCCACPTAAAERLKVRSHGRAAAAVRDDRAAHRRRRARAIPSCSRGCAAVPRRAYRELLATIARRPSSPGVNGRRLLAVRRRDQAAPDPRPDARRGRVPRPARHPRRCRAYHADHPYALDVARPDATRSATCRPSPTPACSAATPTGGARCGSRSTA